MIHHAIVPWLHLAVIEAVLLLFIGAAARSADRESAGALAVIGVLILLFVAAEHGVLAGLRGRWPCTIYVPDHAR